MNKQLAAAIAAGTLALGLLVGAAGATVVGNATTSARDDFLGQMTQMHASMNGMMGSGMMGSGMMGSGMMGPQR
jgi:hypothetical protein